MKHPNSFLAKLVLMLVVLAWTACQKREVVSSPGTEPAPSPAPETPETPESFHDYEATLSSLKIKFRYGDRGTLAITHYPESWTWPLKVRRIPVIPEETAASRFDPATQESCEKFRLYAETANDLTLAPEIRDEALYYLRRAYPVSLETEVPMFHEANPNFLPFLQTEIGERTIKKVSGMLKLDRLKFSIAVHANSLVKLAGDAEKLAYELERTFFLPNWNKQKVFRFETTRRDLLCDLKTGAIEISAELQGASDLGNYSAKWNFSGLEIPE